MRIEIVNHMVQFQPAALDASFAALANATRRGIVEQLGRESASISLLADRFDMTLTGMRKHVALLEEVGLVRSERLGRTVLCSAGDYRLEAEAAWIAHSRRMWEARFAGLDTLLDTIRTEETGSGVR